MAAAQTVQFAPPMIVTNVDFRFIVTEQLQGVGIDPGPVLIEPMGKNTAAAVLAACLYAQETDPEAVLLVAPSDHLIPDHPAFEDAVRLGLEQVERGRIVTFGITPTKAETGYGYLDVDPASMAEPVMPVRKFVEKPDHAKAQNMVDDGHYLWNAGIFLFRARDMIAAFDSQAADLRAPVQAALEAGEVALGFFRLDPAAWAQCRDVSIDYAVMEHLESIVAVPFSAGWSDLGGWDAVWQAQGPDEAGVATSGAATAIECRNSLLRSESADQQIVGLGLENIIAIAMPDAVLVAHKDRAQDVKLAVEGLKAQSVVQAEQLPIDYRPWGWFETLVIRGRFQVKQIHVKPSAVLSLQSHHHRSEHWVVVAGTAEVTVDDDTVLVSEGQSVYIPLGAKHRMRNPGKVPLVIIEIQTGSYLGEDDIIRYEDLYARG